MNIKEIEQYIVDKSEEHKFSKKLDKDDPIVKEVFNVFGNNIDKVNYKELEEYLINLAPHRKYYTQGISYSDKTIKDFNVYDRYYIGTHYSVEYKNAKIFFTCLKDGTIYNAYHRFNIYQEYGYSNYHKLYLKETIEEYYKAYLDDIKKSKRKYMNYYNKKIKDIKQDYKYELKRHNEELKKLEANQ